MGRARIDHTSRRVGKLVYQEDTGRRNKWNNAIWRATCDCGSDTYVASSHIARTFSCGCEALWHPNYVPPRERTSEYKDWYNEQLEKGMRR